MKICIFLIILEYTQFIYCTYQTNFTENGSFSVCPLSFFRRKRAHAEYTRWRANMETTPEFIVKILDDDIILPTTQPIVAINIETSTTGVQKIIVGGAIVPPQTTPLHSFDQPRDYTRFVPPTTMTVTKIDAELNLVPIPIVSNNKKIAILQKGRHLLRDESPPASPQFLARTLAPVAIARQYAPVAPVAFTRRPTLTPLTPLITESHILHKTSNVALTRTSPLPDVLIPTRIKSSEELEDSFNFQSFLDRDASPEYVFLTRSNFMEKTIPERTTTLSTKDNELNMNEFDFLPTAKQDYQILNRNEIDKKYNSNNKAEKNLDNFYNMFIYNDEENDISGNKIKSEMRDNYKDDNNLREKEFSTSGKLSSNMIIESENTTDIYSDDNQDDETYSYNTSTTKEFTELSLVELPSKSLKDRLRDKRRPVCSLLKLRQLNFNSPRTLPEITTQLKQWAEESPVAKWVDITDGNLTTMENPIYMMIVDDPSSGQIISAKQTVMIVAGIQGRDHHAVAAAMYVLYQLIERSEAHADLLTKYRFWVIPVFNPDGYDYSMTFSHRREWSKNLRQNWDICKGRDACKSCQAYGLRCTIQPCYGVNLDRNFEYQWIPAEELRAEHPCGALYAGARQLSEPETRALTHFLHEAHTPLFTFIVFKEGDVLGVTYPYSHTRKRRAFDNIYRQRASRAAAAAYSISGRPYVAGQTSEFLPLYAGGIEDWVDGHLGIDNTYTIMMFRPAESYNSKLITERVVHEAYAAMDTLLIQSAESHVRPAAALVSSQCHFEPSILIIVFLITLLAFICN